MKTKRILLVGIAFISITLGLTYETADQSRPIVCFGSFQDYLGVDKTTGTIKGRNEWVHTINWDLWKPLRPLRMTCPQSPISPRTRTSQNRLLQRSLRHSPQNLSLAMTVLRPKPTRRKAHRLLAAKSTSRATAIHPARLPVPPAALHRARLGRALALE